MANLPTNASMTGSGVTEGGFKAGLNDWLTFCRDVFGTTGAVANVRAALGLGTLALKNDVAEADIATGAVTAGKLGPDAVVAAKIQDGAVTSGKLAASAVISGKIAANAVQTGNVSDGALTTAKLADGAVTAVKIADGVVGTAKLADGAVTPAKASGFPFLLEFESTLQTITAGGLLTLAHGMAVLPKLVVMEHECQTAEAGWAIGETWQHGADFFYDGSASRMTVLWKDGTNIYVRYAAGFFIPTKGTGNLQAGTPANWRLRVRAFA
jgi:hypothetical protein